MEYALETHTVFLPHPQVDTSSIDELANRAGMKYVVATLDWPDGPDLSHLASLAIKATSIKQQTAVLQQLKIFRSPLFKLVDWHLDQCEMTISSVAVVPLTTQMTSKEREEHTGNLELKVQINPDRNNLKYPNRSLRHSRAMYEKGGRLRQVETFLVQVLCRVLNTLADQLVVQYELQDSPVSYRYAMPGLRAKVIMCVTSMCVTLKAQALSPAMRPKYQRIEEELTSDICGINYNAIPNASPSLNLNPLLRVIRPG